MADTEAHKPNRNRGKNLTKYLWSIVKVAADTIERSRAARQRRVPHTIPSDRRSRPMTLAEAAKLMGYRGNRRNIAKRLKQQLEDNGSRFETINRQTYVFDVDDFPATVRHKLLPSVQSESTV
jgi:hypothetical protein